MSEHPIKTMLGSILEGMKGIAEANTVVGDAVETKQGTVIIPMSKVSVGFGLGGSDWPGFGSQSDSKDGTALFGGGGGGGVTIEPVAFLVVSDDDVRLMKVDGKSPLDVRIVDLIPGAIEMVGKAIAKKKKESKSQDEFLDVMEGLEDLE